MVESGLQYPPVPFPLSSSAWSYRADRRDGWRSDNRSVMRAPSLLSSQQPTTSPHSYKHSWPAVPLTCQGRRAAHPRDKLLIAVFKTFWWGFGGERLGVDSVKESKWGASECRGCSIIICVFGCFLSGSFPCITPWISQSGAPTHSPLSGYVFKPNQGQWQYFLQ